MFSVLVTLGWEHLGNYQGWYGKNYSFHLVGKWLLAVVVKPISNASVTQGLVSEPSNIHRLLGKNLQVHLITKR